MSYKQLTEQVENLRSEYVQDVLKTGTVLRTVIPDNTGITIKLVAPADTSLSPERNEMDGDVLDFTYATGRKEYKLMTGGRWTAVELKDKVRFHIISDEEDSELVVSTATRTDIQTALMEYECRLEEGEDIELVDVFAEHNISADFPHTEKHFVG
jgi:hypothetical protein